MDAFDAASMRGGKKGPEALLQKAIVAMLRIRQWHVMITHGNMYQSGFPDLFACHCSYGQRWIEVKLPGLVGSSFTAAQMIEFPKLCANGSGVWILTGANEKEYGRLFKRPNFQEAVLAKHLGITYL